MCARGEPVLSCPKVTDGKALTSVLTCSRQGGLKGPLQVRLPILASKQHKVTAGRLLSTYHELLTCQELYRLHPMLIPLSALGDGTIVIFIVHRREPERSINMLQVTQLPSGRAGT